MKRIVLLAVGVSALVFSGLAVAHATQSHSLKAVSANLRSMAFEKIRRRYFGHGWVQQHTVTGETQTGQTWEAEACIVFTVVDGRIQRLEEYIDPTQFAARG